jgi:hypothetical protein
MSVDSRPITPAPLEMAERVDIYDGDEEDELSVEFQKLILNAPVKKTIDLPDVGEDGNDMETRILAWRNNQNFFGDEGFQDDGEFEFDENVCMALDPTTPRQRDFSHSQVLPPFSSKMAHMRR